MRGAHFFRRMFRLLALLAAGLLAAVLALILLYAWVTPPTTTLMLAERISGRPVVQRWVPIGRISPHLQRAVVLSEDAHFCRHYGVDLGELRDSLRQARRGGRLRGASTIPMQVVKNLFLWPQRSFVRKAVEIPLALTADAAWSKRRMLEIYLNIAEWAPGVFGAEAAARHHFNKSASRLSRLEAARLAAILPNPRRSAAKPGRLTRRRSARIMARMKRSRRLTDCIGN